MSRGSRNQTGWSKRCRNRGSLARPYMERLTNFSFWTWASTGPLLIDQVKPASTAALSNVTPWAKRCSSGRSLVAIFSNQASNR
jgi:hypothetical protein